MKRTALLILATGLAAALNRLYVPVQEGSDTEKTTQVVDNTALGQCTCDITLNSCDLYCCCDDDCGEEALSVWNDNYESFCVLNYIGETYKPFQQCMDINNFYRYPNLDQFNKRMGMRVSEINGQLCVESDAGSMFTEYEEYIETFDSAEAIAANNVTTLLYSTSSFADSSGLENYYNEEDELLGYYYDLNVVMQFPFPQSSSIGTCQNNIGPPFLVPQSTSCFQSILTFSDACTDILNVYKYTSLDLLQGSSPNSEYTVEILAKNIFFYSDDTLSQLGEMPETTFDEATCTCSNALLKVLYNVYYETNSEKVFKPTSVDVEVIVLDELQLDSSYCNGDATTPVYFKQNFDIDYKVSGASFYRSGNPGYYLGNPLLVGEVDSSSGSKQVPVEGYYVYASDFNGNCFVAEDPIAESIYPKQLLNFGQNLVVSCKVQLSQEELKDYCSMNTSSGTDVEAKYRMKIFNQVINNFTYVGIFGNADPDMNGDWVEVLRENLHGITIPSSAYEWDEDTKTCTNMVGIQVRVLASELGYVQNPQNYIVQVQMAGLYDQWTFTSTNPEEVQEFTHYLAFNFIEVEPQDYKNSELWGSGLLPELPDDLFYPLSMTSFAVWIGIGCLTFAGLL